MSDLTNLLELIKNGELSVVAQKLVDMQTTINTAIAKLAEIQLEVQGTGLIPPASESAVGVIHSPSRATNILPSKEMFIGEYYVGDRLIGPSSKTSNFYYGAGSFCFFYFNPSDPNHGVNKKYVDQIITPINNALGNFINRYGDECPLPTYSVPQGTFRFNGTLVYPSRWLIVGPKAGGDGTGAGTAKYDFDSTTSSAFYLSSEDFRWYGPIQSHPQQIATLGFLTTNYVMKTLTNTSANVSFDAASRLSWNDTRPIADKIAEATPNYELATIRDVQDLLSGYTPGGGGGTSNPISYLSASTTTAGDMSLASAISENFIPGFFTSSGSLLTCTHDCYLEIFASLIMRGNNGGTDNTVYSYKVNIYQNSTIIKNVTAKSYDLGLAPGCEYGSKSGMITKKFLVGDTLHFATISSTNDASENSCEINIRVAAGGDAMPAPALFAVQHNVTGSRTVGTTYTNTHGVPMWVGIYGSNGGVTSAIYLTINGVGVDSCPGGASWPVGVTGIVPPGGNYQVTSSGAGQSINGWVETY